MQDVPLMRRDQSNPYSLTEIGKRLKLLRMALGKTQAVMGLMAGVTNKGWQNWEVGFRRPDIDAVTKLRASTGVTAEWIYYGNMAQMPADLVEKMQLEQLRQMNKKRIR